MGLQHRESRGFDRAERRNGVSNIRDMWSRRIRGLGVLRHSSWAAIDQSHTLEAVSQVGPKEAMEVMGTDMSTNRGQRASRIETLISKWTRFEPSSTPRIPSFLLNITNYTWVRPLYQLSRPVDPSSFLISVLAAAPGSCHTAPTSYMFLSHTLLVTDSILNICGPCREPPWRPTTIPA